MGSTWVFRTPDNTHNQPMESEWDVYGPENGYNLPYLLLLKELKELSW